MPRVTAFLIWAVVPGSATPVGGVLSTPKIAPLVGVAVSRFPATSFPAPIVTVAVASLPACTVYRYV